MDKISIIVPVFQAEKYINRCVDSILSQTYRNLELILIDDGSNDKSGSICDMYEKKDERVKVIHKKNAGVAAARNSGLNIVTGEYITFVDSDDYIDVNMYDRMLEKAKKFQCDVIMCDCVKESVKIAMPFTQSIRPGFYNSEQLKAEYYPHLLMMENIEYPPTISNCLLVFKQELVCEKNFPRYIEGVRFSEDLLFGAQLMYRANSLYYMKEANFYHYCINPNSASHKFTLNKWCDYMILYTKAVEYFGNIKEFDFNHQLDLMLLFFVYNALGDLLTTNKISEARKLNQIHEILNEKMVLLMFRRIKIKKLDIPVKLKILTYIYKYQVGIKFLIKFKEGNPFQ